MNIAPMQLDPDIRRQVRPIKYGRGGALNGRVYEIPAWKAWPIAKQIAFIRKFISTSARDPQISTVAANICRAADVPVRDGRAQWAALLAWVQAHIYYVNERDERLQSPQFTLTAKSGDCDDMAILLCALGDSLRLDWRLVISGHNRDGDKVRWVEGQGPVPRGVVWTHIYACGGSPVFRPTTWFFMEPTLKGAPLGWDVIDRQESGRGRGRSQGSRHLPEMAGAFAGITRPVKFVLELPWDAIVAATIPSILSAIVISRMFNQTPRKKNGPRRR